MRADMGLAACAIINGPSNTMAASFNVGQAEDKALGTVAESTHLWAVAFWRRASAALPLIRGMTTRIPAIGIEDLIQVAEAMQAEIQENNFQGNVIEMDDQSDNSADEVMIQPEPLLDDNQVEVFIPMNNGSPLQLIPDDIPEEDMLGQDEMQEVQQVDAQQGNEYMHLDFVQLVEPAQDPVFAARFADEAFDALPKSNPELTRLWAKLLSPGVGTPTSSLPAKCPSNVQHPCLNLTHLDNSDTLNSTPQKEKELKGKAVLKEVDSPSTPPEKLKHKVFSSTGPWSKAFLDQAEQATQVEGLLDTDVTRSQRKKNQFKDEALSKKKTAAAPGGKKQPKKKDGKGKEDADDTKPSKKKPKRG
ncbi:hypothetical protein BAE44_0010914 [Dichanthelium oligosanthes]|uniref:Uncharacterized protein n=1 Tax=Dichanthelium oligosanthes TaxID=888268 RepID=A0A1E5VSH3_9POAL|nr:hypothetical protein BAE44_0010914 [Dichanthelium oligosanthes]